jgi:hypothetical protein
MAPLFFGLLAHGLCIRFGALRQLTRPLSTRLFGANKTYRGLACVALGTAVGFVLIRPSLLPMKQPGGPKPQRLGPESCRRRTAARASSGRRRASPFSSSRLGFE